MNFKDQIKERSLNEQPIQTGAPVQNIATPQPRAAEVQPQNTNIVTLKFDIVRLEEIMQGLQLNSDTIQKIMAFITRGTDPFQRPAV